MFFTPLKTEIIILGIFDLSYENALNLTRSKKLSFGRKVWDLLEKALQTLSEKEKMLEIEIFCIPNSVYKSPKEKSQL